MQLLIVVPALWFHCSTFKRRRCRLSEHGEPKAANALSP